MAATTDVGIKVSRRELNRLHREIGAYLGLVALIREDGEHELEWAADEPLAAGWASEWFVGREKAE